MFDKKSANDRLVPSMFVSKGALLTNPSFFVCGKDLEDESVGTKKPANGRGTGAKRSRAAEVHNLSERVSH